MPTRTTLSGPRKATGPQVILVPDSDEEISGEDRILQERNRGTSSAPNSQGILKRRLSGEAVETSDDSMDDRRDRDASTVSWSDSYADSESDRDSDIEVEEPSQENNTFRKVVSVILSQSHQTQDGGVQTIALDAIQPGDQIRVHNAVILVQEPQPEKSQNRRQDASHESGADEIVVSCLGVSGKTTFTISTPDHVQTARKPDSATPASSSSGSQTATSGNLKLRTKKRRITSSGTTLEDIDAGFSLQQQMEQLQQEHTRIWERNPLELLVRRCPPLHDPTTQSKKGRSSQETSLETTTSTPPPSPCFATLWSANIPGATHGNTNNDEEELAIRDSVCRKTRLQSVMVRAVCAECGNDYKELRCTFGCRSMTWSIFVKMRCEISDGTANAVLEVEGVDDNVETHCDGNSTFQSKEEMMWTLLGLSHKSCKDVYAYKGQGAPFEDVKNRVLQVLARRGEFAYTFDSKKTVAPASAKQPSMSKKQGSSKATGSGHATSGIGSGAVASIGHDHTERAKTEEQLWLDVCSGAVGSKDLNQHFILHATVDRKNQNYHKQALKTTRIPIGRQFFQTLTPPPLILRATYVERVSPFALCGRLTKPKVQ
ncbi:hypothetical protein BG003_007184 [Podila horticola]|nr:hypothetical protein BG003_007184 [Podila horticola]